MKIEMAAASVTPAPRIDAGSSSSTRGGGGGRGGARGGRGGGGGQRQVKKPVTQEELDADLDAFITKS